MKEGWEYKKLGEVCSKSRNIKWDIVSDTATYKYIDLTSVDRGDLCIHNPQTISKADAPSRAKQIVELGDVIFATTRPTLRRVSLIDDVFNGAICSTGFCVLRPNKDISSKWIFYGLQNNAFYNYIEPLQTGASYPAVTDSIVKAYTLPIPPLSEQQKIVSRLDAAFAHIDALKENATKQLSEAKALFQASLKEMLEPKEGWVEKRVGEIAEIKGGKRLPKGEKLLSEPTSHKYIRVADFNEHGSVDLDDIQYISDKVYEQIKRYIINKEDIYISIAGTIGKSGIIPKELDGANLTENACRLILSNEINQRYMYYVTISPVFIRQEIESTKISAQPKLALTRLADIMISYPSITEQQKIADTLDSLKSKIDRLQENYNKISQECDALKQAILRQVFE